MPGIVAGVTFHENWFDTPSQEALAELARKTEGVNGLVVEVGSWEGRSTIALANAVYPTFVHAIDTWEGSPGEISAALAGERNVYEQWKTNIRECTRLNVLPHRMGWREWFAANRDPIRFLFIDAEHTYREVADNIDAAIPYLGAGAIICGDDIHHPPIIEAVIERFPEAQVTATLWWQQL